MNKRILALLIGVISLAAFSSFTVTENTKVCKNISKLSTIEAMKNQKQQERDCSNQNCKELLKSANRQLK